MVTLSTDVTKTSIPYQYPSKAVAAITALLAIPATRMPVPSTFPIVQLLTLVLRTLHERVRT